MITYLRIKNLKNGLHYPTAHIYITNIREPPRSAVSKLLPNRHDMLVGRVHIGKVTTGWLSLGFVSLVRLIWKFNH